MDRLTYVEEDNKRLRVALKQLNEKIKSLEYKVPVVDDVPALKSRLASLERKIRQLESMIRIKK